MARIKADKTARFLNGIIRSRGMTQAATARSMRKSERTVNYQVKHAERMTIETLREYIDTLDMTDTEILMVIREAAR